LVELRGFEPMVIADARTLELFLASQRAQLARGLRRLDRDGLWTTSCSLLAHSPAQRPPRDMA
jgi:hypothetical protein